MKSWYKIVIPVAIAAVAVGGYLIFSKPQEVTHSQQRIIRFRK